jgi:hypothetical protein
LTTKVGVGFISTAILIFCGWTLYFETRHYVPVRIPLAMSIGHIRTNEFTVNIKAPYEIDFEVEKKIPFDTLNCLLGMSPPSEKGCSDTPAVVNAKWILSSDGNPLAQGSAVDDKGGAWANDTISREIGSFDGEPGHRYRLDLDILTDGTRLAAGNPKLTVSVTSDFVEGAMFETGFVVYPLVAGLVLIGLIFLIVSFVRKRRQAQTATVLMQPPPGVS